MGRGGHNRAPLEVKRRYFELIGQGCSGSDAAVQVGVSLSCGSLSCGSLWFIDAGSVNIVEQTQATRPWYKKKRFIIPIAFVAIIAIASVASGGDGGPEKATSSDTPSKGGGSGDRAGSKSNPIKVGETVKLEGTQHTVMSAKTASSVGSEFFSEKANGIYVVVKLTIENKKNETKTFLDEAAKFVTTSGKFYSTDSQGTVAVIGTDGETFMFATCSQMCPRQKCLSTTCQRTKQAADYLKSATCSAAERPTSTSV